MTPLFRSVLIALTRVDSNFKQAPAEDYHCLVFKCNEEFGPKIVVYEVNVTEKSCIQKRTRIDIYGAGVDFWLLKEVQAALVGFDNAIVAGMGTTIVTIDVKPILTLDGPLPVQYQLAVI